ncbi:MAG: formate/nitrite transporter family protein, partial [Wohlfahrtiimonas sp.]
VFIGLGFVYCVIANVQGAGKIVGGLVFSLGLLLTIVIGADLFTSTTMTVISVASKKITLKKMLVNWNVVYFGNFIGALVLVGLIIMSGHPFDYGGKIGLYYISTSEHKLAHTFIEAVGLGILCNIMVCLAVWMSFSAQSLTDKMMAVLFPVGLFIAAGFEHSVANMFMIPAGIYSLMLATPEMLNTITDAELLRTTLTWPNFLIKNLIPVTIGNVIGGSIFIALYQWVIYFKEND